MTKWNLSLFIFTAIASFSLLAIGVCVFFFITGRGSESIFLMLFAVFPGIGLAFFSIESGSPLKNSHWGIARGPMMEVINVLLLNCLLVFLPIPVRELAAVIAWFAITEVIMVVCICIVNSARVSSSVD